MKPAAPIPPAHQTFSPRALKQHERWRKFRSQGRRHFVLAWGVGFWGGSMFLAMAIGSPLLISALASPGGAPALAPGMLAINAVVWAVGGLAFGLLTWHFSEKRFSATQLVLQGTRE